MLCSSVTGYTSGTCNTNCSGPIFYFNVYECWLVSAIPQFNGTSKTCNTGFIVKTNPLNSQIVSCTCNPASNFVSNGACQACTAASITGLTGVTIAGCSACDSTQGFYRSYAECVYCPVLIGASGTVGTSGCDCKAGYYWNELRAQCVCDWTLGRIGGALSTCISCTTISGSTGYADINGCLCKRGLKWNAVSNTCDCDTSSGSGALLINGSCVNCNSYPGSNGTISSAGECGCQVGFIWNSIFKRCDCNYNNNFVLFNSTCRDCASIVNSNGFASQYGCVCLPGYIWITAQGCVCPSGYVNQGGACVACNQITLPSGVLLTDCNTCNQSKGFIIPSPT